ncbi:MAG: hypothetical protein M3P49_16470 [Actinomycetota bacterium]|nr:hypothetical protein [Actinomycetota bacterium]
MNAKPPIDPEGERRLREAGFEPEEGPAGGRWRHPYTGRLVPGDLALARVEHQEEKELEAAGWKREEVEGETYWRGPGSGGLHSRRVAHDLLSGRRGV